MKFRKLLCLLLCFAILFEFTVPTAHATNTYNFDYSNLVTDGTHVVYYDTNSDYTFGIYLDSSTGNGSFSIIQSISPDYLYDFMINVSPEIIDIDSLTFWNELIDYCFDVYSSYDPIYLPNAITTIPSTQFQMRTSSDPYEDDFYNMIREKVGSEPYTDREITTASRQGTLFMLYESLTYYIERDNSYYIHAALSITGFIVSVLTFNPNTALLSTLGIICSLDGIFAAGSTVYEYYVYAVWRRNVRLQNSTINLTNYAKELGYTGYAYSETGICAIVEDSERSNVSTLYNDIDAQFTEAYINWQNP